MSRSLQASEHGQQLARAALKRKSLTQKAIAELGDYGSWSTVNRFFNGKSISRNLFQELCHFLDLHWQDLLSSPPTSLPPPSTLTPPSSTPPPSSNTLLSLVQKNATAAREALTPRILERIPRDVVREKYLGAIARGTHQGLERIIPLIGPAGYGKSTILGNIYDELIDGESIDAVTHVTTHTTAHATPEKSTNGAVWVGLILCSNLVIPKDTIAVDNMDRVFGQSLCAGGQYTGNDNPKLTELTKALCTTHSRGVLLIDTIDLILNAEMRIILATLFRQLLNTGTTIVFTCRSHEYNDYLEPINQQWPGLNRSLDRYTVPNFSTAEIRLAAETFFQRIAPNAPDQGKTFATNILELAADSRPLRDILENPLLLALLCDLFGVEGTVPPDLTVSKLYQRYWREKVSYSRADQNRFSPLALAKESLCLSIAQTLFQLSETRLYEAFYRKDVEAVNATPKDEGAAFNDLLSEGVLSQLPSDKFHFFHQTLLEYAIAHWLNHRSAESDRTRWLKQLNQPNSAQTQTYWYPVLRQYLSMADSEIDFQHRVAALNIDQIGIFSAIAFAAASRETATALHTLLPIAIEQGESHQRRFRQALESASRHLIEDIWPMLLTLLHQGNHTTAINTAKLISLLLERWWSTLQTKLPETLDAIAQRPRQLNARTNKPRDDRTELFGWVLQCCLPLLETTFSTPSNTPQQDQDVALAILPQLTQHYSLFGHKTAIVLIRIYQYPAIPTTVRLAFLSQILSYAVPPHQKTEDALIEFLTMVLNTDGTNQPKLGWTSWQDVLYGHYAKCWIQVQAKAVGHHMAHFPCDLQQNALQHIVNDVLNYNTAHLRSHYLVLQAALQSGASATITTLFTQTDATQLSPAGLKSLVRFIGDSSELFHPDDHERLAQWLAPSTETLPTKVIWMMNTLADASPTARHLIHTWLPQLSKAEQAVYRAHLLRFDPIADHPPLTTLTKAAQEILVRYYVSQPFAPTPECQRMVIQLLDACTSDYRHVALAARSVLEQITSEYIQTDQLLPLLKSPLNGIRVDALKTLSRLNDQGRGLSPTELVAIAQALAGETDQTTTRTFCTLVTQWVRHHQHVPWPVAQVVGTIPQRLGQNGTYEGGVARALLSALKAIAQSEEPHLDADALCSWTHHFLLGINYISVPNSISDTTDLLCAVQRLQATSINTLVDQICPQLAQQNWHHNLKVIILAIHRVQGQQSALLNHLLAQPWCTPKMEETILELRGC